MQAIGLFAAALLFLLTAGGALALGGWLLVRRRERGPAVGGEGVALALTAGWALAAFGLGAQAVLAGALLSLSYLAWLWTLYRLFAHDKRDKSVALIRPVVAALAFVELLQLPLLMAQAGSPHAATAFVVFAAILRLLFSVGALMLVHNLYAGASPQARQALGWPAAGLGALWLYELNFATLVYLTGSPSALLATLRGAATLVLVATLAVGAMRHDGNLAFRPSRKVAFQSLSLLVIGAYLVVMVTVAQALAYLGGESARLLQAGFVVLAAAVALAVLPSARMRGLLRVTLSKHLFQHRYDYRDEWLRFAATMGRAGPDAAPLRERVVQAAADVTDSPGGLLLTPRDEGGLALAARWQCPTLDVPGEALDAEAARFFEQSQFIVDLDDLRQGRVEGVPAAVQPGWLVAAQSAWALVPLLHYDRLVGVVVLARPALARRLDWEDFDLLRVVGNQLASFLAEQSGQDALSEATRFDEFNRRIAFVMHDIKNLASQLSLLAKNAERHADKPEFRADMLVTLRNSTDKLQALLARLGRYGAPGGEAVQQVVLGDVLAGVAARYAAIHPVVVVERPARTALADREGLEQALVHLVQNAIDASAPGSPVFLDLVAQFGQAVIEVIDGGGGMDAEFVRSRLFKPFHSSKPGGFGIGAFEARELVRAMGGRLDVESREGLGTRFRLHLPLAETNMSLQSDQPEVA